MTSAISYESESEIVESDENSLLQFVASARHRKYVKIVDSDETVRFVPLDKLHESERAILENPGLHHEIRQGLTEYAEGQSVSSDWLFDE